MRSKIIPAVLQALISFVIIVPISFFMNQWMNKSEMSFGDFFKEKWLVLSCLVILYTLYKTFLKQKASK